MDYKKSYNRGWKGAFGMPRETGILPELSAGFWHIGENWNLAAEL
jgi:hypothetical protein